MSKLYDALEICLQALEKGADIESVLSRYPDLADELRPILEASLQARAIAVPEPSQEVMRRGRAKLLQRAAEMREAKAPAARRVIPGFQRFAISFLLAAVFLLSGTGLVSASSSALPGEDLYPVKRTWEDLRLFFVFDKQSRDSLTTEFENERLHEVNELLTEKRQETIQFAGLWMEVNGEYYASGIRVVILDTTQLPGDALQNGAAVIVTGHTNEAGFVEAEKIELLPAGTVVPVGEPHDEMETEDQISPTQDSSIVDQNNNSDINSNEDTSIDNGNSNDDNTNINNENTNSHIEDNNNGSSDDHSEDNSNDSNISTEDHSGQSGSDDQSDGSSGDSSGSGED
jgi:Domain of unknown function (DUF5667)